MWNKGARPVAAQASQRGADEHAVFVACEKNFRPAQLAKDRVLVKTLDYLSHEERPEGSGNWGAAHRAGRGELRDSGVPHRDQL